MNPRIRELWDQTAEIHQRTQDPNSGSWENQVEFVNQFAELIVRECAGVAKSTEVDDSADYMSGRWWASSDILKHFGVNE